MYIIRGYINLYFKLAIKITTPTPQIGKPKIAHRGINKIIRKVKIAIMTESGVNLCKMPLFKLITFQLRSAFLGFSIMLGLLFLFYNLEVYLS